MKEGGGGINAKILKDIKFPVGLTFVNLLHFPLMAAGDAGHVRHVQPRPAGEAQA